MLGNRKSQHSFAQTPAANGARSVFDRSFTVKDTHGVDGLIPIYVDEILPGDTLNLTLNAFARIQTLLVPIMDNLYIDYFFFFVPNRLLWTNWEKFCGSQDNPGDSISYSIPTVSISNQTGIANLYEKMGIPLSAGTQVVNALPFRAYNLIWNTWFRDENLQSSVTVQTDNGPDTAGNYVILGRGKRKDYFTSALPWPQKGTAINLLPSAMSVTTNSTPFKWRTASVAESVYNTSSGNDYLHRAGGNPSASENVYWGSESGLQVSATAGGTIDQLIQAMQVQSMLALDARGGTRYVEILLAHFNVVSPDFRLQRPEYLGGGEINVNVHAVPQTSPSSGTDYKGSLAAFSTTSTSGKNIGFTKSFVEHGYIIGLACPRGDITYQHGINKLWLRSTRYDFFWPKLQELGEQTILNKEIWADGTGADTSAFGYQERYAEYRYKPSEIHGAFRSNYATTIDQWHLAEKFTALPALNSSFIVSNTPIARCVAASSSPIVMHDMFFTLKHARPMLTYSVPASLGRF